MILFKCLCLLATVCPPEGYVEIKEKPLVEIKNPDLSQRQTAKVKLCNGLSALIISDPGADQSAAALSVNVGSWLDPKPYPGTAHFLEHLLFLGNEAYPEEDEFMGYVQSNGGLVNAYTASDRTVYMFSVNNNAFDGALNRFSHFFIDPLFDPSGVGRELHAVDQENAKNIENDGWRWWMIMKETGNPHSPNHTFNTGNAETLGKIPPSEVRKWWQEHYSADKMQLVVYSNEPLDVLKTRVVKDFGPIASSKTSDKTADVPLLSKNQLGHMIYIEPVRDVRDLTLAWELPGWAIEDMGAKFSELMGYALSSGADNSLQHLLKKEGLAESVSAGPMRLSNDKALFLLSVDLTPEGVEKRQQVIDQCFAAIDQLKKTGIPKYIFSELHDMAQTNYAWQTREPAFNYVKTIAGQLSYEPLASYPNQTLFYTTYQPQKIRQLLQNFTPKNCSFSLTAPAALTGVIPDHTEKWLGGKYAIRPISVTPTPNASLGLPKPNPFIPKTLEIIPKTAKTDTPTLISNDAFGIDYYTSAPSFSVPEVSFIIGLKSPLIDGTPRHTALLALTLRSITEKLTSTFFYAQAAGLSAGLSQSDLKLTIQIDGYSNKADLLLSDIIKTVKNSLPTEEEFNIYHESLLTTYANEQKAMPFMQANQVLASVIYNDSPTPKALHTALSKITYDDLKQFTSSLLTQIYSESLFAGNISEKNAKSLWSNLSDSLSAHPYPKDDQQDRRVFILSEKSGPYAIPKSTPMQGNAAILLIEQGPFSYKARAAQEILGTALSDDFFKTLRTKQQTGYIARGWKRNVSNQLLQFFGVQSATHGPDDLLSRYELFLETFIKDFTTEFPEKRFDQVKQGVITTLENPPTNLSDLSLRLYSFAYQKNGDFGYLKNIAKAAKELSYEDIQTFAKQFFARANRRRLAVLLEGAPTGGAFAYHELSPIALKKEGHFSK